VKAFSEKGETWREWFIAEDGGSATAIEQKVSTPVASSLVSINEEKQLLHNKFRTIGAYIEDTKDGEILSCDS
jgi:hypothetical protein